MAASPPPVRKGGDGVGMLFSLLERGGVAPVQDAAAVVVALNSGNEHISEAAVCGFFPSLPDGVGEVSETQFREALSGHSDLVCASKLEKYHTAFRTFDCGNNTILTRDAAVLLRVMGGSGSSLAPRNSTLNSTNDNDPMTFCEFIDFWLKSDNKLPLSCLTELTAIFGLVDLDKSGLISEGEVLVLLQCLGAAVSLIKVRSLIAAIHRHSAQAADVETPATPQPSLYEMLSVDGEEGGDNASEGGSQAVRLSKPSTAHLHFADFLRLLASTSNINLQYLLDAHAVFKLFDQSGDGEVTARELTNVFRVLGMKMTADTTNAMMKTIDADGDGVVVFHEFLALVAGQIDTAKGDKELKRQQYLASLCGECQSSPATIDCTECSESYCKECCTSVHSKGRRRKHCEFINIKVCGECGIIAAKYECTECTEFFCSRCSKMVHSRGRRKLHTHIQELDRQRFRAVEYDASNGFGIHVVHDLTMQRFGKEAMHLAEDDLPAHMRPAFQCIQDAVQICQEHESLFIDTAYTDLELRGNGPLPSIGIGIGEEADKANEEIRQRHAREAKKLKEGNFEEAVAKLFTWYRPTHVYATPFLFTTGNTLLGDWPECLPCPGDLIPNLVKYRPGCFEDSWLVLSISMVATHRDLFTNLFVATDFAQHGIYAFQFFDAELGDQWQSVVIDSYIPLMLQGHDLLPTFGSVDEEASLWLIYLMKAYAKFRGAYGYLHRGSVPRALVELTGGEVLSERWNSKRIDLDSQTILWWKLTIATRMNLMVACFNIPNAVEHSTMEQVVTEEEDIVWPEGEHVILTVDVTPMMTADMFGSRKPGGLKFIKLRNLYGKSSVSGSWDWGPESTRWGNKRLRHMLNYKRLNECIQWIDVRDFCRHYNTIVTLTNQPSSPFLAYNVLEPCPVGKTVCHAHQYVICLTRPDESGLVTSALSTADGADENLYDPPDFRHFVESSDEEFCEQATVDRSEMMGGKSRGPTRPVKSHLGPGTGHTPEKKGYNIKLFVSQPAMGCLDDTKLTYSDLQVRVFRLIGKGVQNAEQIQGDDDVAEDAYKWPTYNMLETEQLPVNEPSSNPEKLRELTTLESLRSFTVAQPGYYAVVVEQGKHTDTANYCLAISGKEVSAAERTNLSLSCEHVGSFFDPLYRLDKYGDKGSQSATSLARSCSIAPL